MKEKGKKAQTERADKRQIEKKKGEQKGESEKERNEKERRKEERGGRNREREPWNRWNVQCTPGVFRLEKRYSAYLLLSSSSPNNFYATVKTVFRLVYISKGKINAASRNFCYSLCDFISNDLFLFFFASFTKVSRLRPRRNLKIFFCLNSIYLLSRIGL